MRASPSMRSISMSNTDPAPPPGSAVSTSPTARRSWLTTASLSANGRSEEHTSELQSLMRISYAVFCLKKKKKDKKKTNKNRQNTELINNAVKTEINKYNNKT